MMRDGLEKHGLPVNAEDIAGFDAAEDVALSADKRRRKLWAIDGAFSCSLIGTCLSQEDAARLMRRLQVPQLNGAAPYEIHRFLVRESSRSGVAARLMHKRLEAKYAGMVKRFSKESDPAALTELWENAVAEGKVAAAYWALLTHPKAGDGLKAQAFGDVHMLSHINGGENRKLMQEHTQIAKRFADLEQRFLRSERAAAEKLAGRDKRIRELEEEVARLRSSREASAEKPAAAAADTTTVKRLEKALEDYRRRASVERWRARKAEEENRRLRRQPEEAGDGAAAPATATRPVPPLPPTPDDIAGKSILYVGGRPHVLRHIKAGVEARKACLLHHDGGMEQTTRSLEGMVERADIVVCPVDCVSHDACLRVKSMCKQRGKPFLPLRNAGASSFHRALNIGEEERPN